MTQSVANWGIPTLTGTGWYWLLRHLTLPHICLLAHTIRKLYGYITWCWTFCLFGQRNLMHVKEVEAFNPATFLPLCAYKTLNFSNLLLEEDSQIVQFYPRTTLNRDIFLNNFSVFVPLSTQILFHSSCFVKALAWIRQISQRVWFFAHILENFTRTQKYFTQMPIVTFVTNSTPGAC